jgi:hypothetical protein
LFFIPVPDPQDHPPMRDSDLHEFRPLGPETHPRIKPDRGGLRVQMNLRESQRPCQIHQVADHRAADPGAAVLREYRDATDLTGGFQASCADCVTFRGYCQDVPARRVRGVPFLVLGDALFQDEYAAPDGLDVRAVGIPARRTHPDIGPAHHTSRASRAASPM